MIIRECERLLENMFMARVDSPGLCARMLLEHVTGLTGVSYVLAGEKSLDDAQLERLRMLARRRADGEPMAYILQRKEFYSRDFIVTPATLIPRPETELMVDLALSLCPDSRTVFADLGAGSGCIGLTLLAERPQWEGFLLDNSMPALGIAALNAQKLQLYPQLVAGDMFMCPFAECSLDLVAANPPYVASTDWIMPEVLAYEPHSALFSAQEGLAHLEAVAMAAKSALREHGLLLMEHGDRQGDEVIKILRKLGYREIVDHHDLAGLPRCVMARA